MFATEGVSCLQMTLLWQLLPLENECSERFFDQAVRTTFSPAYYTKNNWDNSLSDPCLFKLDISVLTHPEIYAKRPQVVWLDSYHQIQIQSFLRIIFFIHLIFCSEIETNPNSIARW